MQSPLDDLIKLLDLEVIEVNIFRGVSPDESRQRVFGGQVAGQALIAASRTVDDKSRHVHSLHAYFLRPGDPTVPILYEVDRITVLTPRVVTVSLAHSQSSDVNQDTTLPLESMPRRSPGKPRAR